MIIQAFKSEYTGELFEHETDYQKHVRATKASIAKEAKRRAKEEYLKKWVEDNFTNNVRCFKQLQAAVIYHATEIGILFPKRFTDVFFRSMRCKTPIQIRDFQIEPCFSFNNSEQNIRFRVKYACEVSATQARFYSISDFCKFIGLDTGTGGLSATSRVGDSNDRLIQKYSYEGYAVGRRGGFTAIETACNELEAIELEEYKNALFEYELTGRNYPSRKNHRELAIRNEARLCNEPYVPAYRFDMKFL